MSDGWEGILEEGETVLWQGQPDGAVRWGDIRPQKVLFGLLYGGFAVFWMSASASIVWSGPMDDGPFVLFPLFGLPFLLIGLKIMGGHVLWDAYRRRRTFYTLTDRRAFAASREFGLRRLTAVRIDADAPAELTSDVPPSLRIGPLHGSSVTFEHVPTAREAYRHLRAVQARLRRA